MFAALFIAPVTLAVLGVCVYGGLGLVARPAAPVLAARPVGRLADLAVAAGRPLQVPAPRSPRPESLHAPTRRLPAPRSVDVPLDRAAGYEVEVWADDVFLSAAGRDYGAVAKGLNRINRHGRAGKMLALRVWARTWAAVNVVDDDTIPPIHAVYLDGTPADLAEVDAGELWAARWLAAASTGDLDTCDELAGACDDDTLHARALTVLFTATESGAHHRAA